ncbi:gluconokinase [Gordonia sp. CPCC 206044]
MGVSGCGKSLVGELLAARLGAAFADADDFHSETNREKMAAGIPLTDADRLPWLTRLARWLHTERERGQRPVLACSSLRRPYRDVLRSLDDRILFVHLLVPIDVVRVRVRERSDHHFMPESLVDSQFLALEPLAADEPGITVDADVSPSALVDGILRRLRSADDTQ